MEIRSRSHKFYLGIYDVFNSALAGGGGRVSDNSRVGHRLTWSQAQAKAYRHRSFKWGGKISIKRSQK